MKKNITNIILILVFLGGLSLLLYPTVSDYWNSLHQSRAVSKYADNVTSIDPIKYDEIWEHAKDFNDKIREIGKQIKLSKELSAEYEKALSVDDSGIMGYIEIPKINCSLPIYHGSSDEVLQVAIGHLEWTSLPIGGKSNHSVLSGHRGLPSAKLFTNLDELIEGDTFMIRVLNELYTYEVDQILIVLPHEVDALNIVEGKDLCTLVTCTPYGVNSHRMCVRGHRVENAKEVISARVTADAMQIDQNIVAPLLAIPMLLILLVITLIRYSRRSGKKKNSDN